MENNYGQGLYNEGIFYFTNPTNNDFTTRWNNQEYTFKAKTTVPLIIANEPPENIQHIRKLFAKNLATYVFFESADYKKRVKDGGFIPATYNEDTVLGPTIQACLTPMPKSKMSISQGRPIVSESDLKASKAIKRGQDLNEAFKDYEIPEVGEL
jgi:hypothetical protein